MKCVLPPSRVGTFFSFRLMFYARRVVGRSRAAPAPARPEKPPTHERFTYPWIGEETRVKVYSGNAKRTETNAGG